MRIELTLTMKLNMKNTCKMKEFQIARKLYKNNGIMNIEIKVTLYILCFHALGIISRVNLEMEGMIGSLLCLIIYSWLAIVSIHPLGRTGSTRFTERNKPVEKKNVKIKRKRKNPEMERKMKKKVEKHKKCLFGILPWGQLTGWILITVIICLYCTLQWQVNWLKLNTQRNDSSQKRQEDLHGSAAPLFPMDGNWKIPIKVKGIKLYSNKGRNKRKKIINGNGKLRQNPTAIHWNMGSKNWEKKILEIQIVIQEFDPDIMIISEANMKLSLPAESKEVGGYYMILPKTVQIQNHARLVVLIRDGLEVKVMDDLMDQEVAAVWLKISSRGRRSIVIGAMYREHQLIWQDSDAVNESGSPLNQSLRWNQFIEKWKRAARGADVMVLGDLNLDFLKWGLPDGAHHRMVDKVKFETLGFSQMIQGVTRTWPGQPD